VNAEIFGDLEARDSSLLFRGDARSVLICFYGKEEAPRVLCHRDGCDLFAFKGDDALLMGAVLKQWLCENAMPSAMCKEFSWLNIVELADYYESGDPIEGEFISSWNWIEQFYESEYFPPRVSSATSSASFEGPDTIESSGQGSPYGRSCCLGRAVMACATSKLASHLSSRGVVTQGV